MMRLTSRPAMRPASLVACLWASSKYAVTVITSSVISSPRYATASLLSFCRIIGDLRWRVVLLVGSYTYITTGARDDLVAYALGLALDVLKATAHETLGRVDRTLRVCHRLSPRQLAYQPLPAPLIERHHRRRRPLSLRAGNYDRVAALQDCNAAVGRSEVYPNAFAHLPLLSWGFVSPSVPSLFFLQSSVLGTLAQWLLC